MRARLVPNSEIMRVLNLAREQGIEIAGLDVGRDHVRTIPPHEGGDSLAQYVNRPAPGQKKAEVR